MSDGIQNLVLTTMESWYAGRYVEKHGLVTSYDPQKYLAKVTFQPDGQESGWLPIETGHIGQNYGIVIGLQVGQGGAQQGQQGTSGGGTSQPTQSSQDQGDQVIIRYQEGDIESGKIVQRVHSDQDQPPQAQSGEMIFWTKFTKSGGPSPDAGQGGQGGTGQQIKFLADGTLTHTDGNGATIVLDGKGNIKGTVTQPGMNITHQVSQGSGSPLGGGGLGDIGSQLSGLLGQASALSGAGVGLPGIQSIGSTISGLTGAITGAGGSSGIASAISSLGSQLSSITSIGGASGLLSSLTSQLSSLTSMLNPLGLLSSALHMHVIDQAKGLIASAFMGQHKTTWDQQGVTLTSSTAVTSTAPMIPHNGKTLVSDTLNVVMGIFGQSFNMISDARMKSKIKDIRPVLDDVMALRVKTFDVRTVDWETKEPMALERSTFGLIAQEVEELFPQIVGQEGDLLTLEEGKVGILVLKAFQEHVVESRREIAALRAEVAELRAR